VVLCGLHAQILAGEQSVIRVHSGYEAAAELLIAPADALVIELACLQAPHLKLLEIARSKGVKLLGVGQFPANLTSDDLSGVRLISLADLPAAIAAIGPHDPPAETPTVEIHSIEESVMQQPAFEPLGETYQPAEPITEEIITPPAPQAETADESATSGEYLPTEPPPTRDEIPESLNGLLSPEELSALLEDEK
jgi:hypothetical protein